MAFEARADSGSEHASSGDLARLDDAGNILATSVVQVFIGLARRICWAVILLEQRTCVDLTLVSVPTNFCSTRFFWQQIRFGNASRASSSTPQKRTLRRGNDALVLPTSHYHHAEPNANQLRSVLGLKGGRRQRHNSLPCAACFFKVSPATKLVRCAQLRKKPIGLRQLPRQHFALLNFAHSHRSCDAFSVSQSRRTITCTSSR